MLAAASPLVAARAGSASRSALSGKLRELTTQCAASFSSEKHRTRSRAMNLDMTSRAARVLRVLVVRWTSRLVCSDAVVHAVTRQTQMIDGADLEHSWVSRSMRNVTGDAAACLHRRMFEIEWTLLVGMALNARRVSADCQSRLLQLKTTVWVVTVAAAHGALEHLVVGRHRELMFHLGVTVQTELWLARFQQLD